MPKPPVKRSVTVAAVRELALAMPRTAEKASYGTAGFRVDDKLFARVLEDGESIAVRIEPSLREALVKSAPETFAITAHYENHPWVVVRLTSISAGEVRSLLTEAWRIAAPASK